MPAKIALLSILLACPLLIGARSPNIDVNAVVAEDVLARQPVAPGDEFSNEVGKLVFWTRIKNAAHPTTISHVWYYQNKEVWRIELKVGSAYWRTWSRKSVGSGDIGSWKAVVENSQGEVLREVEFIIKKSDETEEKK